METKNLKFSASRIEKTIICFFYETTNHGNGDIEGYIHVANTNTGASENRIKIKKEDFILLKEKKGNAPAIISIPISYIKECNFFQTEPNL